MKKILSVCLMVMVCFIGAYHIDAKTAKKSKARTSQSASKSFGPSTLVKKGGYNLTFQSNIGSKLVSCGFSKSGNTYTKGSTQVKLNYANPTQVEIYFGSNADRDSFISKSRSLGYQWDGLDNTNGYESGMPMSVVGNKITITLIP